MKRFVVSSMCAALLCTSAYAAESVTIYLITPDGVGDQIGTVTLEDTAGGLQLTPKLQRLPEGVHGFHTHANPSCEPGEADGKKGAGLGAGGHYDPQSTGQHHGPEATDGHLGDLPRLTVAADGTATQAVTAPHLKLAEVKGRSLMIHAGGDNYSDTPQPLGGGGARIACGVIE